MKALSLNLSKKRRGVTPKKICGGGWLYLRRGIFTRGYIYKMLYLQEINCHRPCLAGLDAQFTAAALFRIENDFHGIAGDGEGTG